MRYLFVVALLLPLSLFANSIAVTTNANAGTGSLRDAITKANATLNIPDTIVFRIPDLSEAGRTIVLNSQLPQLESYISIDGTTQAGIPFGKSQTKIKIQPGIGFATGGSIFYFSGLKSDISFYGLFIHDTYIPGTRRRGIDGIYTTNLRIGGLNKGNVINGFESAIVLGAALNQNPIIEYNWIGLNEFGTCNSISETNGSSIAFTMSRNLFIRNNYLFSYHHTIWVATAQPYDGIITIENNSLGTDIDGQILQMPTVDADKKHIYISPVKNLNYPVTTDTTRREIIIKKNTIAGKAKSGIEIGATVAYFHDIQDNLIGTSEGLVDPGLAKISTGIVFGATYTNQMVTRLPTFIITNNKIYHCDTGISRITHSSLWISNNAFFCNKVGLTASTSLNGLGIQITDVTANSVRGTTEMRTGVIEIYSMEDCGSGVCQGFKKVASIKVDSASNGQWNYCGYLEGRLVATQYTADGTTSDFSNCILSPNKPIVTNGNCSGVPGSITGVVIPANASITWRNENGSVVGTSNDLNNVPFGSYYYSVVAESCNYTSDTIRVRATDEPVLDTSEIIVQHQLCEGNGGISNINVVRGSNIKWTDSLGNVVSTDSNLVNVRAGRYRLSISNNTCTYQTQWYTIQNLSALIDTTKIAITNGTCNSNNGSISYNSTLGSTYSYSWSNEQNNTIATNKYGIDKLTTGNYYFNVTRDSAGVVCSKRYGPYLVISQAGPSIDINNATLVHASCDKNNGSITGLQVANTTGSPYYRWEDSVGNAVGSSLNLSNVAGGKYRLKYKDGSGCDTISTMYFTLRNEGAIVIDTSKKSIRPTGCDAVNGSITGLIVSGATAYLWVNVQANSTVATTLSLQGMPPGYYQLQASNSVGCISATNTFYVPQAFFLPVAVTGYEYKDASCDLDNGYLQTFKFSNSNTYSFRWVDSSSGNNISTSVNLTNLGAGNYFLYARDANNCEEKIFSKALVQTGKPQIDLSGLKVTNEVCGNGQGAINGIVVNGGAGRSYSWKWYDDAGKIIAASSSLNNVHSGTYYFTVADSLNCLVTSPVFSITDSRIVIADPVADNHLIIRGTTTDIIVKNPANLNYYLYDTANTTIPLMTNTTGIFRTPLINDDKTFYLRAGQGSCYSNRLPVIIKVSDDLKTIVPNAFSPNNDGVNDTWRIDAPGVFTVEHVSVFDGSGRELFRSYDPRFSWTGYYNGKPLPANTYYYILKGKDSVGKSVTVSGSLVILR